MNAYQRYYQKNRDTILAKMREREALKREERRHAAQGSPEALEEYRETLRGKYHRGVESKITKHLRGWLDDPDIAQEFKDFLKACVWEHRHQLSPSFVRKLGRLSIANAFRETLANPPAESDGDASETSGGETEA